MSIVSYKLESFEGPLDLLLHLISKHKLDIKNIEISLLLEQYLSYIDGISEQDMEYASEFLEMAAKLIYIKTVSLLPQHEEATELKKELEGRLIEYSLCKKAAEKLSENYVGGNVFVRQPVKMDIDNTYKRFHCSYELLESYQFVISREKNNQPVMREIFNPIISKKIVSVTSKIIFVMKKLYNGETFNLNNLYCGMNDKSERVATFLAVLELTKSGRVVLNEDNTQITFNKIRQKV